MELRIVVGGRVRQQHLLFKIATVTVSMRSRLIHQAERGTISTEAPKRLGFAKFLRIPPK